MCMPVWLRVYLGGGVRTSTRTYTDNHQALWKLIRSCTHITSNYPMHDGYFLVPIAILTLVNQKYYMSSLILGLNKTR
jgi:hypothetical protein